MYKAEKTEQAQQWYASNGTDVRFLESINYALQPRTAGA